MPWQDEGLIYTPTERTKLAGIETAATADQTGAEIKTAYEAEPNAYTNTKNTKLAGIETAATADQSDLEIQTAASMIHLNAAQVSMEGMTPTLKKAISLTYAPYALSVSFDLHRQPLIGGADGQIYKNGAPIGTLHSTNSNTYVTFTETISGWNTGDELQLYINSTGGTQYIYARNLKISIARLIGTDNDP